MVKSILSLSKRIFVREKEIILVQFFRYLILSGIALCFDFGLLYFFTLGLGFHYLTSATIAFCSGVAIVYLGSVMWVFHERRVENRKIEILIFIIIGILGLIINDAILVVSIEMFTASLLSAKATSAAVVFAWNFVARKFILFHEHDISFKQKNAT